jgi:acyl-CoA thioesterase-1
VKSLLFLVPALLLLSCQSAAPPATEASESRDAPSSRPAEDTTPDHDNRPVIVAFGDSLTAGYGMPAGQSYPDFLQRELDDHGYSYRVVNEGVSGDTTSAGLVRLQTVLADDPEIAIVAFGGNDGLRGLSVESMEQNLRQIMARLQGAGVNVVLGGMRLPPNYGSEYVNSFEAVYPRLAKEFDIALIPFLLERVAARPHLLYDEIHPNADGNKLVAENVFEVLEPLLTRHIEK